MKKIVMVILLALSLTACRNLEEIKPDTIVDIPLHPVQTETPTVTEEITVPAETESMPSQTEIPTEEATENPTEKTSGGKNNSGGKTDTGGKKPSKGNTGSGQSSKPPATQPPTQAATQPPTQPATQPATEPPTQPPTEPPTQPATEAFTEPPTVESSTEAPTETPAQPPAYDPTGYVPGSRDRAVADAVNACRQEAGLRALTLDTRLCAIASVRAWEVSRVWSHQRPDGSDGLTVLSEYGYPHAWAGEMLYNGFRGAEHIVEKWMNSTADSTKILSENACVIGVGSYTASDGRACIAVILAG